MQEADSSSAHESRQQLPNMSPDSRPQLQMMQNGQPVNVQLINQNQQAQYMQAVHMQQRGLKMSSRERQKMLALQNQNKLSAYGSGVGMSGKRASMPGVRHNQYQILNRKGSEEKLAGLGPGLQMAGNQGLMYSGSRKASIEQRYKSHLRGQEAVGMSGLVRNQSKPTLQLPEIINSAGGAKGTALQIAGDMQMGGPLGGNRSKKSLHGQGGSNSQVLGGYQVPPGQDPKLKNYYDMLEKNRQKSIEKYQNDLTKIYMVSQSNQAAQGPMSDQLGQGGGPVPGLQYQRRVIAQSPSQGELMQGNSQVLGVNHFHARNQSMDVNAGAKIKGKLQGRKNRVLQPIQSAAHVADPDNENSSVKEDARFKAVSNNNSSRGGGGDYI